MQRKVLPILLLLFLLASHALADENLFNSSSAVKEEILSVRDEALDVLSTPFDMKNYGLLATVLVAGGVGLTYVFDDAIRDDVQGIRGRTLDRVADVGSTIGNPLVHIGIAGAVYGGGVLWCSPQWQETGLMLGEAALLADASSLILKESIGRARPFENGDPGSFRPFQFNSNYDSLPSMHTASSFAMASVLASTTQSWPLKVLSYSAASFVGFSRMEQDKHWASDVVLGAAIGELCGLVVTHYHASGKHKFFLAPGVSENSASLAVAMPW